MEAPKQSSEQMQNVRRALRVQEQMKDGVDFQQALQLVLSEENINDERVITEIGDKVLNLIKPPAEVDTTPPNSVRIPSSSRKNKSPNYDALRTAKERNDHLITDL